MDVSSNYNLIPYPDHDYQLKPYVRENLVPGQNFGQEPIAGHNRFRQPHSNMHAIHFEAQYHVYGVGQSLEYPTIDQVGRLIDIYA